MPQYADDYTLDIEIPEPKKDDREDRKIGTFLKVITDSKTIYANHLNTLDTIQKQIISTFDVSDPTTTTKRLSSFILHQAIFKTKKQFKPLDFALRSSEASENERIITQSLLEDTMKRAKWNSVLTNDWGANDKQVAFGDAFISFGTNPVKGVFPFVYRNESISSLYFDKNAIMMRNPGGERECRRLVMGRVYSWDQAVEYYPELERIGTAGCLPEFEKLQKDPNYTNEQEDLARERKVEIGFGYDLDHKGGVFTIFAGSTATILMSLEGDDYPFKFKDGTNYIPVVQRLCFANPEGMLNFGLGHALYKLDILERILLNKGVSYTIDNSNPMRVISVQGGSQAQFAKEYSNARRQQAAGELGIIYNKIKQGEGDFKGITTLRTEPIINEMNAVLEALNIIIQQFGINLRDIGTDPAKTATALELESEASTEFVRELQGRNAAEDEFAIRMIMDSIVQHIEDDDPTPLVATKKIRNGEGIEQEVSGVPLKEEGRTVRAPGGKAMTIGFTLGDLAKTLRAKTWDIQMNERTGVVNSHVIDLVRSTRMLSRIPQGSPAWISEMKTMSALHGRNYTESDFAPPQAPTQAPSGAGAPEIGTLEGEAIKL